MTMNPYSTKSGFGLRLHHAKTALEKYGRDYSRRPYSRGFDNCFENGDGDAVVWALMHEAVANPDGVLAEGIRRTGSQVWPHWVEIYERRGDHAPKEEQLSIFPDTHGLRPLPHTSSQTPTLK